MSVPFQLFTRKTGLCICLFLFTLPSFCQRYYGYDQDHIDNAVLVEMGGGVGVMNCLTDLGGTRGNGKKFFKEINWGNIELSGSGYIGAVIKNAFAIRLQATSGKVKAYDSILHKYKDDSHGRFYRNFSFQSYINEYAVIGEIHPLLLLNTGRENSSRLSPYLAGGIARFNFNPQTYFKGQLVDLSPLRLEGQGFEEYKDRKPYALTATSYLAGLGMRYELGSCFFTRLEMMYRFTSTDYLDDVGNTQYVDPRLFYKHLSAGNAAIATQLYSRSYEVDPAQQPTTKDWRSISEGNDAYFNFQLMFGVVLNRKSPQRGHCPGVN